LLRVDGDDAAARVHLRVTRLAVLRGLAHEDGALPDRRTSVAVGVLLRIDSRGPELVPCLLVQRDNLRSADLRNRDENLSARHGYRRVDRRVHLLRPTRLAGYRV